jgi:hypothetical protein
LHNIYAPFDDVLQVGPTCSQGSLQILEDLLNLHFDVAFADNGSRRVHCILTTNINCLYRTRDSNDLSKGGIFR